MLLVLISLQNPWCRCVLYLAPFNRLSSDRTWSSIITSATSTILIFILWNSCSVSCNYSYIRTQIEQDPSASKTVSVYCSTYNIITYCVRGGETGIFHPKVQFPHPHPPQEFCKINCIDCEFVPSMDMASCTQGDSCMCIDIKIVPKINLREAKFHKRNLGGSPQTPTFPTARLSLSKPKILYETLCVMFSRMQQIEWLH